MDHVLQYWFCSDEVINIDFYEQVLCHDKNMGRIRNEFSNKTNGIIAGCVGAVDGWLVKIRSPQFNEVDNPGKYYSRKQVYGITVQVIVDKKKRVLWRYIGEMGSCHDSQVFHESKLGKFLETYREIMRDMGFYIVGDSANALRSYLLCPYDSTEPGSPEDAFNYYLSSNRIYVECCFGEVDRRWGILWRPIEGKLHKKKYVVDACLRLHNYSG